MQPTPSRPVNPSALSRHFALDWLRIFAFGVLIFYHVGMYFNSEGWHAKSVHANTSMEPLMWLSSPWRLPLLFFISGVAIRFLADKLGAARFASDRAARLLPVILFGMYVVVAPQSYVELRAAGEVPAGFLQFWAGYAGQWDGPWSVHTPTWNHLWYVVYLFVYSLLLAPLIPLLRGAADALADGWAGRMLAHPVIGPALLLAIPAIPLLAIRFTLVPHFPTTHALTDDWANHALSLTFLMLGFLCAKNRAAWTAIDRALPVALGVTMAIVAFLFVAYQDWEATAENPLLLWPARIARVVYAWTMIVALAGLARRFLDRDAPLRRYLTEAIFPYYILHQTITVTVGYALTFAGLGVWTEFAVLAAATAAGCAIGFEIVRRIAPLRPLFGLRPSGARGASRSPARAASPPSAPATRAGRSRG